MQTVDARSPEEQLLAGSIPAGTEPPHANPLLLVHRLLRGNYRWAVLLAVVLGLPLAWLGYRSTQPMYTSEGVIRIAPTQRQILFQTEYSEAIPFFEQYVSSQAATLASQRVLARALDNEEFDLTHKGWPSGSVGVAELVRAASVRVPPHQGLITLSVQHSNPSTAHAACAAILGAYMTQNTTEAQQASQETRDALGLRAHSKESERDIAIGAIRKIAERTGTDDLQPIIDRLNIEVTNLDIRLAEIRAELELRAHGGQTARPPPTRPEDLTVEALAKRDEELAGLLRRRDQLRAEIDVFTQQFSPRHMEVQNRQAALATLERLISLRADAVRSTWEDAGSLANATEAELQLRLATAEGQRRTLSEQVRNLATDLSRIQAFRAQADRAEAERVETLRRLDEITTEADKANVGRAEILEPATTPLRPSSDKRLAMAAAGGMLGVAIGFGAMLLLGFSRGGFRYIDEFDGSAGSLLIGVVPDLGSRREPTAEAALCIHHARALLDRRVPMKRERGRIIAVTSPTAGDGKTTVCCSLATSFAMAGFRTVVVDADFVGRGMTTRLDMDRVPGLSDALAGGPLEESLSPGGTENLTILSAGHEEALGADRLSASNLGPLLDRLARAHDVVLVDSGPVLGSIEATVTVGLADAVLAVVSRSQNMKMFSAMRRKLRSLGTELCGVIFNRALPKDFAHSTHTSVVSAQSQRARSVQVPDFVTMGRNGMARTLGPGVEPAESGTGSV